MAKSRLSFVTAYQSGVLKLKILLNTEYTIQTLWTLFRCGKFDHFVKTGKFEGKRGSGRPRDMILYALATRHGKIYVSDMIISTRDRWLWTDMIAIQQVWCVADFHSFCYFYIAFYDVFSASYYKRVRMMQFFQELYHQCLKFPTFR